MMTQVKSFINHSNCEATDSMSLNCKKLTCGLKSPTLAQWHIQPGRKGSVTEGQLLISLFSIKLHF